MREQYNPYLEHAINDNQSANHRLPTNFKPIHYDVEVEPDFENGAFRGSVKIRLEILEESHYLVLNSVALEINSTEVIEASGNIVTIPDLQYNAALQIVTIPLPEPVPKGSRIELHQCFTGSLNNSSSMTGFMRSSFKGPDGERTWIGSTQGQPTGIRQIFPCADEPALKATFTISIVADDGLTILSNMDIASEKITTSGKRKVVFNKTPPMSTYLVAFVIGELNYIESNAFRVPIRVYATPDHDIQDGNFALEIGGRAMLSHEKTFGSPYPLPKLDMIAVPGHSGGMENWGCVIYAEESLLRDEDEVAESGKVSLAHTVVHELAHQWFGNIVTASWWDSIWLNESFADWATCNALTHIFPEWKPWSQFVAGQPGASYLGAYQAALQLDSNRESHPIEVPVDTPEQISQIFDAITYAKGCSVLRMVSEYLGVEVFIEGVQQYLQKHAFASATTSDLWMSLSNSSGKDVQKIMATWTRKVGYPVLLVTEAKESNCILISQHRFLNSGGSRPEDGSLIYPLYLNTKTRTGIDQKSHLFAQQGQFFVSHEFYKLNSGQAGLYRVSYPLSRWHTLGSQVSSDLLGPDDLVGLLSDFQAIVSSGHLSDARSSDFLAFIDRFRNETNYFVWRQILTCFQDIRAAFMFEDVAISKALSKFQLHLMTPILEKLGPRLWNFKESKSTLETNLKALLFANAVEYDPVKQASSEMFTRFVEGDITALNPNIRKAVFENILSEEHASQAEYDTIVQISRNGKSAPTRSDAIFSLASARSIALVQRTIKIAASNEIQSMNDRNHVLKELRYHVNGVEQLWTWLKHDWDNLTNGPVSIGTGLIVGICVGGLSTFDQLTEVEAFFEGKETKVFDQTLLQSLDEIRGKAAWVERDREDVSVWLRTHRYY